MAKAQKIVCIVYIFIPVVYLLSSDSTIYNFQMFCKYMSVFFYYFCVYGRSQQTRST